MVEESVEAILLLGYGNNFNWERIEIPIKKHSAKL